MFRKPIMTKTTLFTDTLTSLDPVAETIRGMIEAERLISKAKPINELLTIHAGFPNVFKFISLGMIPEHMVGVIDERLLNFYKASENFLKTGRSQEVIKLQMSEAGLKSWSEFLDSKCKAESLVFSKWQHFDCVDSKRLRNIAEASSILKLTQQLQKKAQQYDVASSIIKDTISTAIEEVRISARPK